MQGNFQKAIIADLTIIAFLSGSICLLVGHQLLMRPNRVFEVSLVPETCRDRFVDSKELINKFLESRIPDMWIWDDLT